MDLPSVTNLLDKCRTLKRCELDFTALKIICNVVELIDDSKIVDSPYLDLSTLNGFKSLTIGKYNEQATGDAILTFVGSFRVIKIEINELIFKMVELTDLSLQAIANCHPNLAKLETWFWNSTQSYSVSGFQYLLEHCSKLTHLKLNYMNDRPFGLQNIFSVPNSLTRLTIHSATTLSDTDVLCLLDDSRNILELNLSQCYDVNDSVIATFMKHTNPKFKFHFECK